MSGHSKWAGIKHQKAVTDKKRGKLFTKLANSITSAVKEGGGGDVNANPRLRDVVQAAKDANMPYTNIMRAMDRALGKGAESLYEQTYEGYGPAGVAVLVETITDNKNRTTAEIRSAFTKNGGKLGGPGSVAWMFDTKGVVKMEKQDNIDEMMLKAIDVGAQDVEEDADGVVAYTDAARLKEVSEGLEKSGLTIISKGLENIPKSFVVVDDVETAKKILSLMEGLDDQEDVKRTSANFDFVPEVTAKLTQ